MPLFKSCTLVMRRDIQTCQFLMPYVIQNVINSHSDEALELVRQEIEMVLREGHSSKEGELCVQSVFTLLDMLNGFVTDLKEQAAREEALGNSTSHSSPLGPQYATLDFIYIHKEAIAHLVWDTDYIWLALDVLLVAMLWFKLSPLKACSACQTLRSA